MHPSPSLPPTGLAQSSTRVRETDLPLGRKSVLLNNVVVLDRGDLRACAAG